jgi:hypothetical protein
MGLMWIAVALIGALLLGGAVVVVFGSIFLGMNRLMKLVLLRGSPEDA